MVLKMDITLKIKIKDTSVELTEEEARELIGRLRQMLGSLSLADPVPTRPTYSTWPSYPIVPEPVWVAVNQGNITCESAERYLLRY